MGRARQPYDREYAALLRGDPCCYCGAEATHVDHIVPHAAGGSGSWDNLTAACRACNQSKNERSLLWFLFFRTLRDSHPPQPMKGVRWRPEIRRWDARVHGIGKTVLLGSFLTSEDACAAVDAWHRANPDAERPFNRLREGRRDQVAALLRAGLTYREIAAAAGISPKSVESIIGVMRSKGDPRAPRVGRGGPGRPRGLLRPAPPAAPSAPPERPPYEQLVF